MAWSQRTFWLIVAIMVASGVAIGLSAPVSLGTTVPRGAEIAPVNDAWRAALPRDPEAATAAYMARISAAARARSDAYFEGGYWLHAAGFVAGLLASWVLLASGLLVRMRDAIERRPRLKWLHVLAPAALFLAVSPLLTMPFDVYQGFYREHVFNFSNLTFAGWLGEQLTGLGISVVLGGLFLWLIYAVLRRFPQTWWVWAALVSVAFLAFVLLISPTYIDPLFNTYKPLADEKVRAPILAMARASGVPAENVYQFDASKQSNRISANVSGIFGSASIRLNDNLLNRTSLPEIKAVMGHEIGHYVLNHVYKMLLVLALVLVLGFAFLKWALAWSLQRWGTRFAIRGPADPAGMPLLVAIFSIYMFAMTPVVNTMTRVQEVEADLFGLNASREGDGMAEVGLKLVEYRKADPGPVEEFFFYTHPSPRKRILASMRWKAEHGK